MMNTQRQEAYLNLIQALLNCPNGQEAEILNCHQNLVDTELVQMMAKVAKKLAKQGDYDTTIKLQSIAAELAHALVGMLTPQEAQLNFLLQVLRITANNPHPQVMYPLLANNIDRLNNNFIEILQNWANTALSSVVELAEAENIARDIGAFSDLIQQFALGDRAMNLEIAIAGYEIATTVFSHEIYPEMWAKLQNNLGIAYTNRLGVNRSDNLEKAMNFFNHALLVRTRHTFPEQWAMTKINLSNAYDSRLLGDKADNLEKAISCCKEALLIFTRENFPKEWAIAQNNLGETYINRLIGEKEDNLERAINCFEQALLVRTQNSFPDAWAKTKVNMGNAYINQLRGEKKDNLEKAINCFEQALSVCTQDSFPEEWAIVQNNLGIAYKNRLTEEKEPDLEKAINCFEKALLVFTRCTFPEKWARTKSNLGNAYSDLSRIKSESNENDILNKLAIKFYREALQVLRFEFFPKYYGETQYNIGIEYLKNNSFQLAKNSFFVAIYTVEFLRSEIISGDEVTQKLAEEWNKLYQYMVEVCLQLNCSIEALEYVERSKTRNLVELILTKDRHTIFPTEVVAQLDRLRDEIASGQYQLQNATAEDPTALAQHLQQLRQQRNELQDRYLPIGSGFQFDPFRLTLSHRTAIVEFYITSDKLLVFIVTKQTQQPIILSPDLIDLNKLANWANSYLKAYSYKNSHWQRRLTTRLHLLAKILHIDEIIQQIPTECDKLILIPHRYLHLLPLHALPLAGDSSFFDRFHRGVSYAPNCQLLQLSQTRQRSDFTHLFAVQNPTGDLTYTDIEVETIQSYFSTSNLLKQKIATREAIDDTSLTAVHCAHFCCHGYFNATQPRKSALILANAQLNSAPTQPDTENYLSLENGGILDLNKCLTLDSIFTLNLEQCRLVTLSACETGLIDFRNTSDEYIGLPSGFLYAGAISVVSSLWTVNDLSTAFLMIRFYQNLQKGLAVALALNQAQLWLKNLNKGDLETWIKENQLPLNPTVKMNLLRRVYQLEDAKPFQSPFYWAAFCVIGQ